MVEPSAGLHKEPSAGLDKEPSAALNKQPSAALDKEPSAGLHKQPSAALNKQPSAGQNKQPSAHEEPFRLPGNTSNPDWRIWLGVTLTATWLLTLSLYIGNTVGWINMPNAPIEQVGNFLEGAFAPLAFLWLVIGYFLQKKELMQNTDAIKMQYVEIQKSANQAVIQSEAIRASESHVRKQSFLQIADAVKQQLGGIAAFLFLSSQGGSDSGAVTQEQIGELWGSLNNKDPEGFSRSLLQLSFVHGERYGYKLMYGTEIRTKHCDAFIFNFERLLDEAQSCDDTGLINDALLGMAHGHLYQRMMLYRKSPPAGFTFGVYDFDPDSMDT